MAGEKAVSGTKGRVVVRLESKCNRPPRRLGRNLTLD